ncbi:hypothetical protein BYT27DRAFT_7184958 [Phlegmacium glaucopus]|nr:hypothetical protein BYT27DRAFT_7184958 [Phlegmacium glaucopus]
MNGRKFSSSSFFQDIINLNEPPNAPHGHSQGLSTISPCLGPVTFMEEKQASDLFSLLNLVLSLGRITGTQVFSSSLQRVEHRTFPSRRS